MDENTEHMRTQHAALTALAEQDTEGPREYRIEAVCDDVTNEAIMVVTDELGSRSKAVRALLKDGARYRAARLARKLPRA